ncbi:SRPBCC family protein [Arthrobacter sp. M-10]|jgi:uncharacterized membrane protein|uniref:SRPBCC family protein n=1 Tax=Arthrobacter sp. M-10 TaxID=3233037 RepID=UPI003F8FA776
MNDVHGSINVNVPVRLAYEQWMRFEEFPLFMSGVESATWINEVRVHFRAVVGAVHREYDAWIIAREPDEQIAWESVGHPLTGGTVLLEPLGPAETKILLRLSWETAYQREMPGRPAGLNAYRIQEDLERFKELVEGRQSDSKGRPARAIDANPKANAARGRDTALSATEISAG